MMVACGRMSKLFESVVSRFRGISGHKGRKDISSHELNDLLGRALQSLANIENRMNGIEHGMGDQSRKLEEIHSIINVRLPVLLSQSEYRERDILEAVLWSQTIPDLNWSIVAERAVAADTNDHLFPRGTKIDNTRHPRFVRACEAMLASPIRHLDVGCGGGGLVWDFTRRGHLSVGVEGSDYSLREQRVEWRTIPDRLFTADICYPFHFQDHSGQRVIFDVISAWELFEHIPEAKIGGLLNNITSSLRPGGYVVASIATFLDRDERTGVVYHHTVQPQEWWAERFKAVGLMPVDGMLETADFVRGSGNPTAYDWDVRCTPEVGFHMVLQHRA